MSHSLYFAQELAISDFPSVSVLKLVLVRSLCYEYESFILKLQLITITKISHLDSLEKGD